MSILYLLKLCCSLISVVGYAVSEMLVTGRSDTKCHDDVPRTLYGKICNLQCLRSKHGAKWYGSSYVLGHFVAMGFHRKC